MNELVLSLFPGIGLLDRAFSSAGFCVVQAADKITGGDVREFAGVAGRFDGIIAGPPCQGFSCANTQRLDPTHPSVVNSRQMLAETMRIIQECRPDWWLIENVPTVPDVRAPGFDVQRLAISDWECGGVQLRSRAIQFGSRDGSILRPVRVNDRSRSGKKGRRPIAVTTKMSCRHHKFADQCRKQGLPGPLRLPGFTKEAKFRAVGNGVPLTIGRVLAAAVRDRAGRDAAVDCRCGCGRSVLGPRQRAATSTCRKRLQLQRERAGVSPWVDQFGYHEPNQAESGESRVQSR